MDLVPHGSGMAGRSVGEIIGIAVIFQRKSVTPHPQGRGVYMFGFFDPYYLPYRRIFHGRKIGLSNAFLKNKRNIVIPAFAGMTCGADVLDLV